MGSKKIMDSDSWNARFSTSSRRFQSRSGLVSSTEVQSVGLFVSGFVEMGFGFVFVFGFMCAIDG